LGFSDRHYPVLQGFLITRLRRGGAPASLGEIILVIKSFSTGITVLTEPADAKCRWNSLNHGALDDPGSCDTAYSPPVTDFDILTVRIESGCRLPPISGQLKISILP
jgi:hypothetical protein